MPITQALNSKANVKKFTNDDIPFSSQQPVINSYYASSTLNQTVINYGFSIDLSNKDVFFLFVDGKKLREGAGNDYTFTSVGSDNTSQQVTLTQSLAAGLNIQAYKLGLKAEVEFLQDNRFSQLYEAQGAGFQGFVSQAILMTPTTVTGTPAAGTFYSSIANRAPMVDLSQDLQASMGIRRIHVQQIREIANEFGPNGEPVFTASNDTFGQMRFVGTNWSTSISNQGLMVTNASTVNLAEYVEITFYGTGLNLLGLSNSTAGNYVASVDGGANGSNIWLGLTTSNVLQLRNYTQNQVLPVVSGLTLGVHTVRIFNNAVANMNINLSGFEILNDTSLRINPGIGYIQSKKYLNSAQNVSSYSSVVTGTRGGRVVAYLNGDGTVGKSWTPTNASQALLTSADHTNEEVARVYSPREFGQGRADDFSRIGGSGVTAAFTLDDGTTSLQASSALFQTVNAVEGLAYAAAANQIMFTFVGTGLDIQVSCTTLSSPNFTYQIDGSSAAAITFSNNVIQTLKIVSGLPYGTHTFKLNLVSISGGAFNLNKFIVYQPKKPSIPSGSIEITDYNVMANFTANATAGAENIATGVLRKAAMRELIYSGTSWTIAVATGAGTTGAVAGIITLGAASAQTVRYSFFGTGFDFRLSTPVAANTFTMTIDGTNPTAAGATATGFYGQFASFVAGTGVATSTGTGAFGSGLWVSGLALGHHTVVITQNAANQYGVESCDVISPVHSHKTASRNLQNQATVGSQSLSDSRALTPIKDALPGQKAWAQAFGILSNPSTTATSFVPLPDMAVEVKTSGGDLKISYSSTQQESIVGASTNVAIFINGAQFGSAKGFIAPTINYPFTISDSLRLQVPPGTYLVQLMWNAGGSGTSTGSGVSRNLLVEEM